MNEMKLKQCKLIEHRFGVDTDREFACHKCGYIFVETERVSYADGQIHKKVIKQNLLLRFGDSWRFEWFKLQALQLLVKKITYSNYDRDGLHFRLNGQKIYQLEDFILEPEEFIKINVE